MSNIRFNWVFKLASASMLSFVVLGARYGHKGKLDEDSTALFQKAQLYHVSNSFGLIASCLVASGGLPYKIAVGGFIAGSLIFVAPLYYMAVQGRNNYITKTMPIGGFAMIVAWLALIFA